MTTVTAVARQPRLFAPGRVADTIAGRFETMTVFASLAILRLRSDPAAERVAQSFVDQFFRNLDAGLRESGVGDLTVPKKMKAIAGAVYGRMAGLEKALACADDVELTALLERTVFGGAASAFAGALAAYIRQVHAALATTPLVDVESAAHWPLLDS